CSRRALLCWSRVVLAEPAAEIDLLAPCRAERAVLVHRRLAADGAAALTPPLARPPLCQSSFHLAHRCVPDRSSTLIWASSRLREGSATIGSGRPSRASVPEPPSASTPAKAVPSSGAQYSTIGRPGVALASPATRRSNCVPIVSMRRTRPPPANPHGSVSNSARLRPVRRRVSS